jgi:MtN3 and saliva related transmembrane protein
MDWIQVLGLVAGIFTTAAAVPQLIKAWKSKKVEDVSPLMFSILILGVSMWTLYGVLKADLPIILTNGISVLLNSTMLVLIFKYRK